LLIFDLQKWEKFRIFVFRSSYILLFFDVFVSRGMLTSNPPVKEKIIRIYEVKSDWYEMNFATSLDSDDLSFPWSVKPGHRMTGYFTDQNSPDHFIIEAIFRGFFAIAQNDIQIRPPTTVIRIYFIIDFSHSPSFHSGLRFTEMTRLWFRPRPTDHSPTKTTDQKCSLKI